MPRFTTILALGLVVLAPLLLAACGGGGGGY
jgi:predicted small secreted protein